MSSAPNLHERIVEAERLDEPLMGPTVCEEEGPTPIEKRSKVEITACSARGRVEESGMGEGEEGEKERISEWEECETWNDRRGRKGRSRIGVRRSCRAERESIAFGGERGEGAEI